MTKISNEKISQILHLYCKNKSRSQREIARNLGISYKTVRYWISKYKLKDRHKSLKKTDNQILKSSSKVEPNIQSKRLITEIDCNLISVFKIIDNNIFIYVSLIYVIFSIFISALDIFNFKFYIMFLIFLYFQAKSFLKTQSLK